MRSPLSPREYRMRSILLLIETKQGTKTYLFYITILMRICVRFSAICVNYRRTTLKGKRTDPELVLEIRQLRRAHRPAEIVRIMDGRVNRRTVYRILERLRREDEERWREDAEKVRLALEREEQRRRERIRSRGVRKYSNVSQFPARLRKVRSV